MDKAVNKWIAYARADLRAAEILLASKKANQWTYVLALWHCHQAVEKMFKMVIVSQGKELLLIHDLAKLIKSAEIDILPSKFFNAIDDLNPYYIRSRYPDIRYRESYPRVSQSMAARLFILTKELFVWLKRYATQKKP